MIAGATDKIVESCAFPPENEHTVARKVELVIFGRSALVETDNPEVLALQVLKRAHEVDHARDPEMFRGACAGLYRSRAERRRATLGENDAIHPRAVSHTQQGSQILRIFHTVESQHQPRRRMTGDADRRREEIFNLEKLLRPHHGNYSLVRGCSRKFCQLLSRFLPDAHARLAAVADQSRKTLVVALAGHDDVVKAASACLECLRNRMHSVEDFHEG